MLYLLRERHEVQTQILLLYTHNEPGVLCNSTHTCNPSHEGAQRQEDCWGLPVDMTAQMKMRALDSKERPCLKE